MRKTKNIILVSALMSVLFAGSSVFAQSTGTSTSGSLAITSTPVGTSITPGTGVSLGTITLTSPGGTYNVNSIPVNLSLGGGALANNLSNCKLFNTSGASTTTALGASPSIVTGANSFSISPPLNVTSGNPVTLQIRCDVNSAAPAGSTFQFSSSATSTSVGAPATGPSLSAQADFVKQVPAGLNNAIIGIITLDATHSNQDVTVNSVPISVSASGGATLDALTNCVLTSPSGTVLTTGGNSVAAITGSNNFMLDKPLTVQAGQGALLVLRCNVSSTVPQGSMLTVGFAPTSFQALAGGSPVTVTQGTTASGQPGTNSAAITIGAPGSSTVGAGSPSLPGAPNTGAGGEAPLVYAILAASLMVFAFAFRELLKTR
jgi:hypothetical protein